MQPPLFLVYGKIIVDNIRLRSGEVTPGHLGGGGPQAAFGARLWSDAVALLTRSGTDLEPVHEQTLRSLGLDLHAWMRYPDLPTPRGLLEYDEHEQLHGHGIQTHRDDWFRLLDRPIALAPHHRTAAAIHLVTEFGNEPITEMVLQLGAGGALTSVEPIFDDHSCPDRGALLALCRQVDLVTPDWSAATSLSGMQNIRDVLRFWAALGPRAVAIRRGAHGSVVWDRDHGMAWHIPALPVEVVDPTGAGNAYGGGWFVGWHRTGDARLAGCYATTAAALMLSHPGMPPMNDDLRRRAADLFELALARTVPLHQPA